MKHDDKTKNLAGAYQGEGMGMGGGGSCKITIITVEPSGGDVRLLTGSAPPPLPLSLTLTSLDNPQYQGRVTPVFTEGHISIMAAS